MPSPAGKSAPIPTGLRPPSASAKKDKTPRNSPGATHAGGRTPRANNDAALPLVAPPDPRVLTKKARKVVNIKGNRGKGQSKSGAGGVAVDDNDDKQEHESGSGSSEEYDDDVPRFGSAPKAEVQMDELVEAAKERAANGALASPVRLASSPTPPGAPDLLLAPYSPPSAEPVKLSAGYELITNPASKPMFFFDTRRGHVARRGSLASSTGFTDESDWSELNMGGVEVPVQRAKYAEVLKRAPTAPGASAVVGGARA
jgi:hypothetical protein